jgi:hypothetical protein
MAIKQFVPELTILREKISPDEIDRYEVYSIRPAVNGYVWASAGTAGTSAAVALTVKNTPDWPRNINFALAGSHGDMTGTLNVNGKNQFGATQTESITFTAAANGGTAVGTKIFSQITSGTLNYGTAVGAGTPSIGFVPGTACLLGLPVKLRAATDVVHLSQATGTGAITFNGGTIAAFVDYGVSAIRPVATLDGTAVINVWVKPTYAGETYAGGTYMSNMTALV